MTSALLLQPLRGYPTSGSGGKRVKRRVLVVDDNVTARMGARALLDATADFACAAVAPSGHEALEMVATVQPDLVLMDVNMDGLRGAEVTRRLIRQHPDMPVVAWTSSTDSEDLIEMIQAGCVGYTLKDLGPSELNKALQLAMAGETPIPRQLVADVIKKVRPASTPPGGVQLTKRETEVLSLMASGHLGKEIAKALAISVKSVEAHMTAIYQKLGAKNRSQAVALALEWGLIAPQLRR